MKKTLTMVLAFALIFALGIGATLAWLTATSGSVTNTFTTSDINITLTESDDLDLKMVPGHTITKDPEVTVKAGSEPCYLFVKVEKSSNFNSFMTYEMAAGWEQGNGTDIPANVYYRVVDTAGMGTPFGVLKDNQVQVNENVTKADMNALTDTTKYPTLTFTAYASQLYKNNTEKFTASEAWTNAQPTTTSGTNP